MTATFPQLLAMMLILFLMRPLQGDITSIFKSIMIMGAVGISLKIVSFSLLTSWASNINKSIGATAVAGSLVLVALNYAIVQSDIPFLPNNAETVLRYLFYILGGVLMLGSAEWGAFFKDVTGIIGGGGGGLVGVMKDVGNLITLGLSGS